MNLRKRVSELFDDLIVHKKFWGREQGEQIIFDLVFDAIDHDRAANGQRQRQTVHLAANKPFAALCGAEDPNQTTTNLVANITCPQCRQKIGEPSPK